MRLIITVLCAAALAAGATPPQDAGAGAKTIRFINRTPFTVRLVRGSGRIDAASIAPRSEAVIPNDFDQAETYYPLFDIPLAAGYSLAGLRPDDRDMYYQIDRAKDRQEIEIPVPAGFSDTGAYIVFTNNATSGGVFLSRNENAGRMTGINTAEAKSNVNAGETLVYRENPGELKRLRLNPGNAVFGAMAYRPGYVYSFEYNGASVTLIDERPLRRAGESSWAKTITEADGLIWPAPGNGNTSFFVPTARGLARHDYDSAGVGGAPVSAGERFEIAHAGRAGDGFLLAGYAQTGNNFRPITLIQGEDGATRGAPLSPSARRDRYSAYYLSAAAKDAAANDGAWLLAGGADSGLNRPDGYRPYLRLIKRDSGGALVPVWEIGGDEFNAIASGNQCGPISAAAYDPARDRWLAAGKTLEWDMYGNSLGNSWLAIINAAGTIQHIDTAFKGLDINKILTGPGGSWYIAGEERKGGESYAFCVKYSGDGRELWRLAGQPPSYSYVQDAVLDGERQRIVLAGTMRAADPGGQGGVPFTEGLDAETGKSLWRVELKAPALSGTSIVTGVTLAPDYGYILTLSGIADNDFARPFGVARINSQGKIINEQ